MDCFFKSSIEFTVKNSNILLKDYKKIIKRL